MKSRARRAVFRVWEGESDWEEVAGEERKGRK